MTRRTNVQHGQKRSRPLPMWLIALGVIGGALAVGCLLGAPSVVGG
ncbi:hypothetical protein JNB62_05330 [Microbacterium jejuense]|uniref:Uncharacterized protein n=1 Tax=Microbacterium jejuense TaxID=1263637 RepID=A0ABS7HJL8_9MICO|nr:hypothetical protein [Microbacterium jejuense]MBW9093097.1 hypothetical protein [Microbacterium jejuense]